jgi:hypothetical protein
MFNSTILDVAMGMVFVYLLLSLLCSAANELIELVLKKRARELESGITELLTEQNTQNFLGRLGSWIKGIAPRIESWVKGASTGASAPSGVVADLYNHSLISGLFKGQYEVGSRRLPAYIPSTNFALAMLDLVRQHQSSPPAAAPASITSPPTDFPNSLTELRDAVANMSRDYDKVKNALLPLIDAAGNDVAKARKNIENWYDSAMDRVSGWYKRRAQIIIFMLGLIVAVALNVDSVIVAKRLSSDRALRDSLVAAADSYAKANATASPSPKATPKEEGAATETKKRSDSASSGTNPKPSSTPNQTATPKATPSPKATPTPVVTPTPIASPSTATQTTSASSASPSPTPCWEEACKADKEAPQCKLKKSQCELVALGLPIGWLDSSEDIRLQWPGSHWKRPGGWWDQIAWHWLGWLLTALAVSLGAPFWFDMLNKIIVVRSTVKPKEKSPDEPSKG